MVPRPLHEPVIEAADAKLAVIGSPSIKARTAAEMIRINLLLIGLCCAPHCERANL
jgi:hypothetical protein